MRILTTSHHIFVTAAPSRLMLAFGSLQRRSCVRTNGRALSCKDVVDLCGQRSLWPRGLGKGLLVWRAASACVFIGVQLRA